jgi:hypothetical protein
MGRAFVGHDAETKNVTYLHVARPFVNPSPAITLLRGDQAEDRLIIAGHASQCEAPAWIRGMNSRTSIPSNTPNSRT